MPLESLTGFLVTPVMAYYLLPRAKATHHKSDSWLLRGLKTLALPMIRFSMAAARPLLDESLALWRAVGDRWGIGVALRMHGVLAAALREIRETSAP